jgi:hypothetical protein
MSAANQADFGELVPKFREKLEGRAKHRKSIGLAQDIMPIFGTAS